MDTLTGRPTVCTDPLDLRGPRLHADPYRVYREMRERGRVHLDTLGIWLLIDHADVRAALTDNALGRDPRRWHQYERLRPYLADSTLEATVTRWMIFNDPPAHTRLRRLMGAAFTPAATRAAAELVGAAADALIDRLPAHGTFDFMQAFAQPFPVRVIADLLGLPADDFARTKAWSDALALVVEPAARRDLRLASDAAAREMLAYLRERVDHCRTRPGDSLLHRLIRAQDVDGSLDEDELLANVMLLFVAGHETTTNLLGNGLLALLSDPAAGGRLRADETLLDTAVEEMLRYDPAANVVARIARAPWTRGEVTIPAGALIYCLTGAANRDPAVFANPERFDVARSPNPHLSFGGGVHFCLGAPLARLEARIALSKLLRRLPRLRLDGTQPPAWRALVNLRGLERLALRAD